MIITEENDAYFVSTGLGKNWFVRFNTAEAAIAYVVDTGENVFTTSEYVRALLLEKGILPE